MPTTAKPVSPFFGHDSTVPPPLPSMLTDQIELFGSPCCPMMLLADEVLAPAEEDLAAKSVESSDSDLTSSVLLDESKIPKPIGEPGHPGHGEYTLEIALDWNHKIYVKFKKHIFHPINEHLDITKCASVQNPTLLRLVCNKAVAVFPDLDNYAHAWPLCKVPRGRDGSTSASQTKVCPGTSGHVPGLCRFLGPGTDGISHIAIHLNAIIWDVPRLPWVAGVPTPESAAYISIEIAAEILAPLLL
ncbi:hypothetical protein F5J12DRAFT_780424 [Pisolithus orientalis]|uniref:uncharacterized protein n=1 Tax=Pisolithus orientalis TaxID=936130 RepID=UPI002225AF85|nr:uncharacterized protein F5J12DRAFT_780424 [Pisolithus orientalis]KAI6028914.1 hypothetical protein F5J12DRAFT_780424 [Pisolithus orientalis]